MHDVECAEQLGLVLLDRAQAPREAIRRERELLRELQSDSHRVCDALAPDRLGLAVRGLVELLLLQDVAKRQPFSNCRVHPCILFERNAWLQSAHKAACYCKTVTQITVTRFTRVPMSPGLADSFRWMACLRWAFVLLVLLAGCTGSAPRSDAAQASPPPPRELGARWLTPSNVSFLGPRIPEGIWAVLGGRRVLLRDNGTTSLETAPTDEILIQLGTMPKSGDAGHVLLAASEGAIYRFDEPLGRGRPIWRTHGASIERIGFSPDRLFVWLRYMLRPIVLDATGAPIPDPPVTARDILFLDRKRGAAILLGAGLSVTNDGGSTWRAVPRRVEEELRHVGGTLSTGYADHKLRVINLATATLDEKPPALSGREQWVVAMGRAFVDPLELAIAQGADLGNGTALAPIDGGLARVDLSTGMGEIVPEARWPSLDPHCEGTRSGAYAWFSCQKKETAVPQRELLRVPLVGPHTVTLALAAPAWDTMHVTAAGGLELSRCEKGSPREEGSCVLQPDGSFAFIAPLSRAGSARDGALYDLEIPKTDPRQAALVARYPSGRTQRLTSFAIPTSIVRLESLDEDADGTFHLIVRGGSLHYIQWRKGSAPRSVTLQGLDFAEFRFGHGYGYSESRSMISRNGMDWERVARPPDLEPEPGRQSTVSSRDIVLRLAADHLGSYRVNWGPDETPPPRDVLPPRDSGPAPPPPSPVVSCKRGGPSASLGFGAGSYSFMTGDEAPAGQHRLGDETGRLLVFTETAGTAVEATPAGSASRGEWRVDWADPAELGGRPRTWSGKAARGGSASRVIATSMHRGEVAFGLVYADKRAAVVRIDASGSAEVRHISSEDRPVGAIAFGSDKRNSLAWLAPTGVFVWPRGAEPHRVAAIGDPGALFVAGPTDSSVTIGALWGSELLIRELPLAGGAASDAWQRIRAPFANGAVPAVCRKGSRGPAFGWSGTAGLSIDVDKVAYTTSEAKLRLQLSASGLCAETALLKLDRRTGKNLVLRADLQANFAEIGVFGVAEKDAVAVASCAGLPPQ